MKAIIFAAGLGTRLQPLTNNTPKALVKLNGEPLLYHAISQLKKVGVDEIIVNVHHFADQIINYLYTTDFGIPIHISDERDKLLDTGGGIKKVQHLLKNADPFIAYNVDVFSSISLKALLTFHKHHSPLATLVVRKRETSRYLMFDQTMKLTGWKNISTNEQKVSGPNFETSTALAFSGIHIISPEIFPLITKEGKFSIVPLYLELAKKHTILGYKDSSDFWIDLGKPGQIEEAELWLKENQNH